MDGIFLVEKKLFHLKDRRIIQIGTDRVNRKTLV